METVEDKVREVIGKMSEGRLTVIEVLYSRPYNMLSVKYAPPDHDNTFNTITWCKIVTDYDKPRRRWRITVTLFTPDLDQATRILPNLTTIVMEKAQTPI